MSIIFSKGDQKWVISGNRGLNILGHAQMEEINLGSRCGGHGVCGADRVRVLSGAQFLSVANETEKSHLSPEELQQGWRLGCQTWLEDESANVEIFIPASRV